MSRARSKYRPRSSRVSSGSWAAASGVNPTRSAKSTVTRRRSDPPERGAGSAGSVAVAPVWTGALSEEAHSEQNFAVGGFVAPHDGQASARRAAHSLQNFAPTAFSVPQFAQIIVAPLDGRLGRSG